MIPSVRDTLVKSHVGAAIIAVLVLWSVDGAFQALWPVLGYVGRWLLTAIAILDIPYFSFRLFEHSVLLISAMYIYTTIASLGAAWALSRWLYGVGLIDALSRYRTFLKSRSDNA